MPFYIYGRYEDSIFGGLFAIKLEVRSNGEKEKECPVSSTWTEDPC